MEASPDEFVHILPRGVRLVVRAAAAVGFALLFLALGALLTEDRAAADEPALISDLVDAAVPDIVAEPLAPVTEPVLALVDPIVTPVVAPVVTPIVAPIIHTVERVATAEPLPVIAEQVLVEPVIADALIEPAGIPAASTAPAASPTLSPAPALQPEPAHVTPLNQPTPEPAGTPDPTPATLGGSAAATGAADIQSPSLPSPNGAAPATRGVITETAPFPSFEHDSSPD